MTDGLVKSLRSGLDTPGILLPRTQECDKGNQHLLLALFALSVDDSLSVALNSLAAQYPRPESNSKTTTIIWADRLASAVKDTTDPFDLAECLKFMIRRIKPSTSIVDRETYRSFSEIERDMRYPMKAFDDLLAPRLPSGTITLLEQLFDLCAALAAHSEANGLVGGKAARLFGAHMWGSQALTEWSGLYVHWRDAGRRMEHLFYAWIR